MADVNGPSGEHPFRQFFLDEYTNLLKYLRGLGAHLHEAEDAAQEAMAQLFRNWNHVRNPRPWVRTAARHLYYRSVRYWSRLVLMSQIVQESQDPVSPDRTTEVDEFESFRRNLTLLPPAQREVIAYRLAGYEPNEIAEIIGKKPETVRTNLAAARRRLKKMLPRQRLPRDSDGNDQPRETEGEEQE